MTVDSQHAYAEASRLKDVLLSAREPLVRIHEVVSSGVSASQYREQVEKLAFHFENFDMAIAAELRQVTGYWLASLADSYDDRLSGHDFTVGWFMSGDMETDRTNVQKLLHDNATVLRDWASGCVAQLDGWIAEADQALAAAAAQPPVDSGGRSDVPAPPAVTEDVEAGPSRRAKPKSVRFAELPADEAQKRRTRGVQARHERDAVRENRRLRQKEADAQGFRNDKTSRDGKRKPLQDAQRARARQSSKSATAEAAKGNDLYRNYSFDELRKDEAAWADFSAFVRKMGAGENIDFLDAVREYKSGNISAEEMYATYIRTSGPSAVNINSGPRSELERRIVGAGRNISADMFDRAVQEVMSMLANDPMNQYVNRR